MKQFKLIRTKHLNTFHVDGVGAFFYYLCTIEIEGKNIQHIITFSCDDLCESLPDGKDTWDDNDLEKFVNELARSQNEVLASNKSIEDIMMMADFDIREYNDNSYLPILTNRDLQCYTK